jgi:hypothetical protein
MTAAEIVQIITSIGTLVGIVTTAILTLRNGQKSDRNFVQGETIHEAVNGLGEKRNVATQKSAHAEGVLDEKERAARDINR